MKARSRGWTATLCGAAVEIAASGNPCAATHDQGSSPQLSGFYRQSCVNCVFLRERRNELRQFARTPHMGAHQFFR